MTAPPTIAKNRRRALVMLLALVAAGAATIALVRSWTGGLAVLSAPGAAARAEAMLIVFAIALVSIAILAGVAAIVVGRIGARTRAAAQFPPPGVVVLREVAVVAGAAAKRRGAVFLAIAALLGASAIAIAVVGAWIVLRLDSWIR